MEWLGPFRDVSAAEATIRGCWIIKGQKTCVKRALRRRILVARAGAGRGGGGGAAGGCLMVAHPCEPCRVEALCVVKVFGECVVVVDDFVALNVEGRCLRV